jgi:hypothetical protein
MARKPAAPKIPCPMSGHTPEWHLTTEGSV